MFNSRNVLSGKRKYLFGLMALSFVAVLCAAFNWAGSDDFEASRREVLLRRIGHELLLQSGDGTSRVLPVQKIAENQYRVSFEKEFAFEPDALVTITSRLLGSDPYTRDYVVNVLNCTDSGVAYGYAISKNKKDDIVACRGRVQPKACYMLDIRFRPESIATAKNGYLLGSCSLLAFFGFIFWRSAGSRETLPEVRYDDVIAMGAVAFDPKNRKLVINGNATDLTATETRLLLIFALSPNEAIERSRLQKEIWEDEGVIVGRSLDMFISKLRKKLEPAPDINIVVIRGKGYKLEIGS